MPKDVRGVRIGQHCAQLHMLQAGCQDADGTPVGRYVLHYADGETRELPIIYGQDIRNWWTVRGESTNTPNAQVVWRGNCPMAASNGESLRLWKRTYSNPWPDVRIVGLDFVSAMNKSAPFLVALTIE